MEAPRWRLTNPHYLNVHQLPDGTRIEWEHRETARETGRTVRKLFPVPMYLDPKDPTVFNYPGEIIVAHEIEGCHNLANDYIFSSAPTQDMEPLNAEAEAITDSLRDRWANPVDTLPANGGMTDAESIFMQRMTAMFEKIAPPHAEPATNEVTELRERLAKLEALLAAQAKPQVERRA